jgi:hypothetical protein
VDDRDVAEDADDDVARREVLDPHRDRSLLEEAGAVDQRAVGIGAVEVLGQDLVEPLDVGALHRVDVVAVEGQQGLAVGHGHLPDVGAARSCPARAYCILARGVGVPTVTASRRIACRRPASR